MPACTLKTAFALALVALLAVAPGAEARIYKTVDENGNVVFTDVPPKDKGETVELTQGNRYSPTTPASPASNLPDPTAGEDEDGNEDDTAASYNSLSIVNPTADQAIRENAGNVTVSMSVSPEVDVSRGHQVRLMVDGQIAGSGTGPSIALSNVDRGEHVLLAQVVDASGAVLIASQPVKFHMLRYSKLLPPPKKPPPGSPPPKSNPPPQSSPVKR